MHLFPNMQNTVQTNCKFIQEQKQWEWKWTVITETPETIYVNYWQTHTKTLFLQTIQIIVRMVQSFTMTSHPTSLKYTHEYYSILLFQLRGYNRNGWLGIKHQVTTVSHSFLVRQQKRIEMEHLIVRMTTTMVNKMHVSCSYSQNTCQTHKWQRLYVLHTCSDRMFAYLMQTT